MSASTVKEWLFAGQDSHVTPETNLPLNGKYKCLFQLVVFGLSNQMVVAFKEENTVAFKHLFLKGYMDRMDDTYAVYTQTDVYDQIFFAINQVSIISAVYTMHMFPTWVPFHLPSCLMVSEIKLLWQLLKTRMLTHSGFLPLLECCTCGDILKASMY